MTSSLNSCPTELWEQILSTLWHSPLSFAERKQFILASTLVCTRWSAVYDLVAARDVYIVSPTPCDEFRQRVRAEATASTRAAIARIGAAPTHQGQSFVQRLLQRIWPHRSAAESTQAPTNNFRCRSITISLTNCPFTGRLSLGSCLDELLETLDVFSETLPNLRRLNIEYTDASPDDLFTRRTFAGLPPQLTHLHIRFTETASSAPAAENTEHPARDPPRPKWYSETPVIVSIFGVNENVVKRMSEAVPCGSVIAAKD